MTMRLTVKPGPGHFAQVQINESLTFDFGDAPAPWGGPPFDPRAGQSHHCWSARAGVGDSVRVEVLVDHDQS
ncbi:MAG: hypothetical protein ACREKS_22565 [Candidatus Rokuibacteriota bacterium]